MTGVHDAGSMRVVLSGPAVRRTFGSVLLGRLAFGVLPICLLFTVRGATGSLSFGVAALASFGAATLAMPVQSRLVDRHGQRCVVPAYAAAYVALLIATWCCTRTATPDALWLVSAAGLGLTTPALGPAMRAQWREIASEGRERRTAYALDSFGEESVFLVGPAIGGGVVALGHPDLGLLVAAALMVVGTAGLVTSPHVPTVPVRGGVERPRRPRGELVPLGPLLVALALAGAGGSVCFVAVAQSADAAGRPRCTGARRGRGRCGGSAGRDRLGSLAR